MRSWRIRKLAYKSRADCLTASTFIFLFWAFDPTHCAFLSMSTPCQCHLQCPMFKQISCGAVPGRHREMSSSHLADKNVVSHEVFPLENPSQPLTQVLLVFQMTWPQISCIMRFPWLAAGFQACTARVHDHRRCFGA